MAEGRIEHEDDRLAWNRAEQRSVAWSPARKDLNEHNLRTQSALWEPIESFLSCDHGLNGD